MSTSVRGPWGPASALLLSVASWAVPVVTTKNEKLGLFGATLWVVGMLTAVVWITVSSVRKLSGTERALHVSLAGAALVSGVVEVCLGGAHLDLTP